MFARTFRAGLGTTAALAVGLSLVVAGPAIADPPSGTTPTTTDIVGVGSDTTQIVMNDLATAYNAGKTDKLWSFDACIQSATTCNPGGTIDIRPAVTIPRPNGSGAGKALLYGTGQNLSVDFARSSSGLSTAEVGAQLQAIPYAVDTLITVVSQSVGSNAPTALGIDQILGIYNGTFTNWSQLGGNAGVIKPYLPQSGSGTRSFFLAQLQAANGGVAPTLASTVTDTQEHDPTAIKGDANAVAPYSQGRAATGGAGLVRPENGWLAQRAVYNVVRNGAPAALTTLLASFCDSAYKSVIETDGFKQMEKPASGGACGIAASGGSTTNFKTTSASVLPASSTTAVSLSPSVRAIGSGANAVVTVSGSTGIVTLVGRGFVISGAVNNGQAVIAIPANLPAGSYPVRALYSGNASYQGSSSAATLTVTRANSGMSVSVKLTKAKKHKKAKTYTATVRLSANGVVPTGAVVVKRGSKVVGTASVRNGVATVSIKIAKLKKGKNKLTVTYLGDGNVNNVAKTVTVKRKK